MIAKTVYEDMITGAYHELVKVDNPSAGKKFGWYLRDTISGSYLASFFLDKSEPIEIASRRAREHCRQLGFRETRVAK